MSLHTGVSPSGLRHGTLTPIFAGSNPATPASRPLGFSARQINMVEIIQLSVHARSSVIVERSATG